MQKAKPSTDEDFEHGNNNTKKLNRFSGSLWECAVYGGGTLLITVGPVLAGMDAMKWTAIFMALNAAIVIIACLLGIWKNLTRTTQSSRQRR